MWFYPLQTLNVFELLYIFSLGFWVYQFGAKSYEKGLITHKMQTAKIADRIYVIEDGVVTANGSPAQLLKTDNFFSQLVLDAAI